ncbi:MAG: alkylmercury lyase family protein [Thiotrichales bacterium]
MSAFIDNSLLRLNELLPLKARQDQLSPTLKALHQAVITSLVTRGRAPSRSDVAAQVGEDQVDAALARLGADDLVVLSADRREILGAYPVTTENTPHEVRVNDQRIHAMCALDALSVGPMYNVPVAIHSRCRVTGATIEIQQDAERIVEASPTATRVGVRWQAPLGSAAHSLCMEMVFLGDDAAAQTWHGGDLEYHSVYTLEQAVEFGARYFRPLL